MARTCFFRFFCRSKSVRLACGRVALQRTRVPSYGTADSALTSRTSSSDWLVVPAPHLFSPVQRHSADNVDRRPCRPLLPRLVRLQVSDQGNVPAVFELVDQAASHAAELEHRNAVRHERGLCRHSPQISSALSTVPPHHVQYGGAILVIRRSQDAHAPKSLSGRAVRHTGKSHGKTVLTPIRRVLATMFRS